MTQVGFTQEAAFGIRKQDILRESLRVNTVGKGRRQDWAGEDGLPPQGNPGTGTPLDPAVRGCSWPRKGCEQGQLGQG